MPEPQTILEGAARPTIQRWTIILVLSALVLVASIAAWTLRRWYAGASIRCWPASAEPGARRWIVVIGSDHGSFFAGLSNHTPVRDWAEFQLNSHGPPGYNPHAKHAGFGLIWDPNYHTIFVPSWFTGVTSALLIMHAVGQRKRQRRIGFCHRCGYDLRASPDRCPECGEAVVTATAA
ncbi:MAG: hypothetical protein H7Z14_16555 [Anaerolineae bacterium]|nr:hypothetical protein [Phycisphaerae bacterium]